MRKIIALPTAAIVLAISCSAQSAAGDATDIARRLGKLSVDRMILTFACRDLVGGLGQYQFARAMAVENGVAVGLSRDEATIQVDNIDRQLKSSTERIDNLTESFCVEDFNELSQKIDATLAEFRLGR